MVTFSDQLQQITVHDQYDQHVFRAPVAAFTPAEEPLKFETTVMTDSNHGTTSLMPCGSEVENVRSVLQPKNWFAFDLDDTLHNFQAATGTALQAVFFKINTDHGVNVDVVRKHYRSILAEKTSSAFVDGRTSREYRKERFGILMQKVQVTYNDHYLELIADLYQQTLSRSLSLKPGSLDLLKLLKSMDKKIIIITEGPEDAQLWTVQQLGIYDLVDCVATTNRFGVSKVDGLLEEVMLSLGIAATDLAYIGDSKERDVEPAVKANVYAIHYAENEEIALGEIPIRVNSHWLMYSIIGNVTASKA